MKRDVHYKNRNLNDHKALEFAGEKGKEKWEGNQLEVNSDPLVDEGVGDARILRQFKFGINPVVKYTPTKQEIFNSHLKQIEIMLWSDGLEPYLEIAPRISVDQKFYSIFVVCKPRKGNLLSSLDKPKKLQEVLNASRHS